MTLRDPNGDASNPYGSSAEESGAEDTSDSLDFKWEAITSDHNGHRIFVDFDQARTYTMEISARS